jgi:uncharacterized protein (TIRG00374 family)
LLKSRRFLSGLILSILFVVFFLFRVDLPEMTAVLKEANYLFVLPSLLFYLIGLFWRTVRWRNILVPLGRIELRRLWPVVVVGYTANNVLPMRLGELIRAYYLGEREKINKAAVVATILIERLFDGLTLLFLIALVAFFLPVADLFQDLAERTRIPWLILTLGFSVPFLALSVILLCLTRWPSRGIQILQGLANVLPKRAGVLLADLIARSLIGLSALKEPKKLLGLTALSFPVWLSEAGLYIVVGISFGLHESLGNWPTMVAILLVTTCISNLGTSIPSTGGGVGPFEFFCQATLIFFGVAAPVASAYTLVVHAVLLLPVTVIGVLYLWTENLSIGRLARVSQVVAISETDVSSRPTEEME